MPEIGKKSILQFLLIIQNTVLNCIHVTGLKVRIFKHKISSIVQIYTQINIRHVLVLVVQFNCRTEIGSFIQYSKARSSTCFFFHHNLTSAEIPILLKRCSRAQGISNKRKNLLAEDQNDSSQ